MGSYLENYHIYKCAVQQREGDEVQIRDLKCKDIMEVHQFLKRLHSVSNVADLSFLEIHEQLPDGKIALVHESRKPWPTNVPQKKMDGIYVPKVPKSETRVKTPEQRRDERTEKLVAELAAGATTIVGGASLPDEEGRPLFPYKSEVA